MCSWLKLASPAQPAPAPLPEQPAQPEAVATIEQIDGLDIALQGQLVGQVNLSGQHGLAVATAISDDVRVTSENVSAGGDGIKAISSAEATAPVVQTATQSNSNSATATFDGSEANIGASSENVAEGVVEQVDGLDLALQGQLVGQLNVSGQSGLAIATAISDEVTVKQSGYLDAGGSGIVAESSAEATAPVVQTATQSNKNSAEATFGGNQANVGTPDNPVQAGAIAEGSVGQEDGLDLALQGQLVGQVNLSFQRGAAIATAISDDVTVNQTGYLSASGGDGIDATSSAEATAPVVQTATQSNENSATATFGGNQAGVVVAQTGSNAQPAPAPAAEPAPAQIDQILQGAEGSIGQSDGIDVALQGQLVGQVNLSGQHGLAVATAISHSVTVTSEYDPASGDGIKAISSAEATAPVVQTATQSNDNSATATFGGNQATIGATAEGPIAEGLVEQVDGLDLALQGQLVGQLNLSGQSGLAIATALSGPVSVTECCDLEAGKNGIIAKSEAEATAPVVQTATQSNKNSAEATFGGNQADVGTPDNPVQSGAIAEGLVEQVDGLDLALQGQLVGQVNLSFQRGAAIATAISDDVTVNQAGYLQAWDGDGIDATSSAEATAPVVQTATQSNENSAAATFGGNQAGVVVAQTGSDAQPAPAPAEPVTPIEEAEGLISQVDGIDVALQGQLVGQVNLSGQHGLAVATAISHSVTVTSEYDPAGGNGIKAVSSAEATAPVVQTATQSNDNSATATFGGNQATIGATAEGPIAEGLVEQVDGLDLALQGQLVGQLNLSGQSGLAIATALSGPVSVTECCDLEAGKNGIIAKSEAEATAPVVQTATQSNKNSAEATFGGNQANVGTPDNPVQAGALAEGSVEQVDGLDLALQGQLVGQVNLSFQRGAAIATAISDDVTVDQALDLTAWDGDGIDATSSAEATAPVVQTATQSNENSATATFGGNQAGVVVAQTGSNAQPAPAPGAEPVPTPIEEAEGLISQVDGIDVALQGQLVGQLNVSGQHGLAIATAISDEVTVTSGNVSAGSNGIKAVSSAEATAPVVQTATQSNVNSAETTFNGSQANIDASATGTVLAGIEQVDGLDLSLQGQLVGQLNLSGQGGLAIATALSDPVTVNQSGYLDAGGSGIIATSSAIATAPVVQTVSQSNDNSAKATFGGSQSGISADAGGDVILADEVPVIGVERIQEGARPGIEQIDGLDLALQGQLVGQVNLSVQRGASIATAISDDVTVNQSGYLSASDGDGIAATSSAVATAPVVQTVTQSNSNSAEASFGGSQAGIDANAGGNVIASGEPTKPTDSTETSLTQIDPRFDPGIVQVDGLDIALQGQLVGQVNLSGQRGLAVATAISDDVTVTSEYDPASGDGIKAISSAKATAPVVQTATQSNENSATASFDGSQADLNATAGGVVDAGIAQVDGLDLALQGQLVGQVNLSGQSGLAIATALSDSVSVTECCSLEAGNDGIVAKSSAEAVGPVVQTASQSNSNSAEATFGGSQANIGTN